MLMLMFSGKSHNVVLSLKSGCKLSGHELGLGHDIGLNSLWRPWSRLP